MGRAFATAHFLDVPGLCMSGEVGLTRPRQARHECTVGGMVKVDFLAFDILTSAFCSGDF
jgi:hypothetical protein